MTPKTHLSDTPDEPRVCSPSEAGHHVQVTASPMNDDSAVLYLDCPCGWSYQWDHEAGSTQVPYDTVRAKVDAHLAEVRP